MSNRIDIIQGDDKTIGIIFTDLDGEVIDITDYTMRFTVKERETDADASAVIAKEWTTHTDPENGATTITLVPVDTEDLYGSYVYDLEAEDGDGRISTPVKGIFRVQRGVYIG